MRSLNEINSRNENPLFIYRGYSVVKSGDSINIAYDFAIDGLCDFKPTVSVETDGLVLRNDFDSPLAKEIIFNMGMVEAVSYFKAVCPKKIVVECGALDESDKKWWKHLWFNGLGEFFHINSIKASEDDFIEIVSPDRTAKINGEINLSGKNIIPIGGGKDSCVTTELLKRFKEDNMFFTVNDQKARTDCVEAAGYDASRIIRTHRTIDKNLLELNKKGYLNGHTPFSAVVAFLSLYCAYLTGAQYVVLSNESSANEGNTDGGVNHQYSKSFEFEYDFNSYVKKNITDEIKYFSLLRPFNELQIAKMFSTYPEFLTVFRSCNKGSKTNVWCENCPKCLFVYGMLSAFLSESDMKKAFKTDMFNNETLLDDFLGLTGLTPVKPFECVGTAEEYNLAVATKILSLKAEKKELPLMLKRFDSEFDCESIVKNSSLLSELNTENLVPDKFKDCVAEMFNCVSNN